MQTRALRLRFSRGACGGSWGRRAARAGRGRTLTAHLCRPGDPIFARRQPRPAGAGSGEAPALPARLPAPLPASRRRRARPLPGGRRRRRGPGLRGDEISGRSGPRRALVPSGRGRCRWFAAGSRQNRRVPLQALLSLNLRRRSRPVRKLGVPAWRRSRRRGAGHLRGVRTGRAGAVARGPGAGGAAWAEDAKRSVAERPPSSSPRPPARPRHVTLPCCGRRGSRCHRNRARPPSRHEAAILHPAGKEWG